jgi:hypothetical protein
VKDVEMGSADLISSAPVVLYAKFHFFSSRSSIPDFLKLRSADCLSPTTKQTNKVCLERRYLLLLHLCSTLVD